MSESLVQSVTINKYQFSKDGATEYVLNMFMKNAWPIVYIIKNDELKEAYVGESTNAIYRMQNHLANPDRLKLKDLLVISCDKFNKSAVLDIESNLIKYMGSDGRYKLQNRNVGLVDHNYYQRDFYQSLFDKIWQFLLKENYAKNPLQRIDNSDLFKYSPYKALNNDQHESVSQILKILSDVEQKTIFVEGGAGTGKTILAVYLMKLLNTSIQAYHVDESDEIYSEQILHVLEYRKKVSKPKTALVVPMTSLRKTLRKVFAQVKGLSASMVIGPSEVASAKEPYDVLIVDEAHRLRQRKNITNFASFDQANKRLGFDKYTGNELDWIIKQSKVQILFYDQGQSIKPSDIGESVFQSKKNSSRLLQLQSQMRVKGGLDYISFVDNLLNVRESFLKPFDSKEYELKIFDSLADLYEALRLKEEEHGLCRLLSGYSWEWKSQKADVPDIELDGLALKWNSTNEDWINSPNSFNEVGCIHTTQGYDLNYAGIIFGTEITFNEEINQIEVIQSNYKDKKGKQGVHEVADLRNYILNIYKTMMLRGMKGTYIYVCDDKLKGYFKKYLNCV
ncbi:MAG: hypothetical protein RLZ10_2388 [Bacteroidota bacterium]|jgi:DUF2075 family protein